MRVLIFLTDWLGSKMIFFVLCSSLMAVPFDGWRLPLLYSGGAFLELHLYVYILLVSIYKMKLFLFLKRNFSGQNKSWTN